MGLKDPLPVPTKHTCERCKATVEIRTQGLCRAVMCGKCRSLLMVDPVTGALSYRRPYKGGGLDRYLQPGDEGVLFGRRYMVVGCIAKRENGTVFKWNEYHLFNPVHGFAQLSLFNGHWTFHEQLRVYPRETHINQTLIFERNVYEPFNNYTCIIDDAVGEFTHDIQHQQRSKVRELISPPYMLTRELDDDELAWYMGRYVKGEEIRKAFNKKEPPPPRIGVGACQPMELAVGKAELRTITIGFVIAMLVTMFIIAIVDGSRTLMDTTVLLSDGRNGEAGTAMSAPFTLDRDRSSVELQLDVPNVNNSWFELSGALINNATGAQRSFVMGVEYYHGYTDGESWSEGGHEASTVLSALPAGQYHLELFGTSDPSRPISSAQLRVKDHVTLWSNLFVLLGIGLLFPLITWWRISRFEQARWGE